MHLDFAHISCSRRCSSMRKPWFSGLHAQCQLVVRSYSIYLRMCTRCVCVFASINNWILSKFDVWSHVIEFYAGTRQMKHNTQQIIDDLRKYVIERRQRLWRYAMTRRCDVFNSNQLRAGVVDAVYEFSKFICAHVAAIFCCGFPSPERCWERVSCSAKNMIFLACMTDFWRVSNWMEKLQFQRFWCGCGRNGDERKWCWRKYQWIWCRFSLLTWFHIPTKCTQKPPISIATWLAQFPFISLFEINSHNLLAAQFTASIRNLNWTKDTRRRRPTQTKQTRTTFIIDVLTLIVCSTCFCLSNKAHSHCVLFSVLGLYLCILLPVVSIGATDSLARLSSATCSYDSIVNIESFKVLRQLKRWTFLVLPFIVSGVPLPLSPYLSPAYALSLLDFQFEIGISLAWWCQLKLNWSFKMSRCFRLSKLSSGRQWFDNHFEMNTTAHRFSNGILR